MEGSSTLGGDIQGTDEDGSNVAGLWDAVQGGVTDCANIWEWQLGGYGRYAEGAEGVPPQSVLVDFRNDGSEGRW